MQKVAMRTTAQEKDFLVMIGFDLNFGFLRIRVGLCSPGILSWSLIYLPKVVLPSVESSRNFLPQKAMRLKLRGAQ